MGYATGSPAVPSVPATPFLQDVRAVDVGANHACAIKTDGKLLCWGGNRDGQLGIGKQDSVTYPTPEEVPGITVDQVVTGPRATCAVSNGEVWCWGYKPLTGTGSGGGFVTSPTRAGTLTNIKKVHVNQSYAYAIGNDGSVWFWGVLGSKVSYTPAPFSDPTPEDPARSMTGVVDGIDDCFLFESGKVRCVETTGGYRLTEVLRVDRAKKLTGKCVVSKDDELLCWGNNTAGVLAESPTLLGSATLPHGERIAPQRCARLSRSRRPSVDVLDLRDELRRRGRVSLRTVVCDPPRREEDEERGGDEEELLRRRVRLDALAEDARRVLDLVVIGLGRELRSSFTDRRVVAASERGDEGVELGVMREVLREARETPGRADVVGARLHGALVLRLRSRGCRFCFGHAMACTLSAGDLPVRAAGRAISPCVIA